MKSTDSTVPNHYLGPSYDLARNNFISDTCTLPTEAMLKAMGEPNPERNQWTDGIGDVVYEQDPTIHRLQKKAAEFFGKEDCLFVLTGTMANLIAVLVHCKWGESYIVGSEAHILKYEAGGTSVLGSCIPYAVPHDDDGCLNIDSIEKNIRGEDLHFAKTTLLCIENPIWGKVHSLERMKSVKQMAEKHGLNTHLDGARVLNAAVALNCDVKDITQYCDTLMCCTSKGLCAPVGSLLLGNKDFIARSKKVWKMLGGGWRQAGVLASAALIAITEMRLRLPEDHETASYVAQKLVKMFLEYKIDGYIDLNKVQTNIVMITFGESVNEGYMKEYMSEKFNLKMNPFRLVFHKDNNTPESVETLLRAFQDFFENAKPEGRAKGPTEGGYRPPNF